METLGWNEAAFLQSLLLCNSAAWEFFSGPHGLMKELIEKLEGRKC